jgi:hypothetical protein
MIRSISFDNTTYWKSAEDKLQEWSKTMSRDQIISVSTNDLEYEEKVITVFYWEER